MYRDSIKIEDCIEHIYKMHWIFDWPFLKECEAWQIDWQHIRWIRCHKRCMFTSYGVLWKTFPIIYCLRTRVVLFFLYTSDENAHGVNPSRWAFSLFYYSNPSLLCIPPLLCSSLGRESCIFLNFFSHIILFTYN